jgi:hypothetical protein
MWVYALVFPSFLHGFFVDLTHYHLLRRQSDHQDCTLHLQGLTAWMLQKARTVYRNGCHKNEACRQWIDLGANKQPAWRSLGPYDSNGDPFAFMSTCTNYVMTTCTNYVRATNAKGTVSWHNDSSAQM